MARTLSVGTFSDISLDTAIADPKALCGVARVVKVTWWGVVVEMSPGGKRVLRGLPLPGHDWPEPSPMDMIRYAMATRHYSENWED